MYESRKEKRKSHENTAMRIAAYSILAVSQPRSTEQMKNSNKDFVYYWELTELPRTQQLLGLYAPIERACGMPPSTQLLTKL